MLRKRLTVGIVGGIIAILLLLCPNTLIISAVVGIISVIGLSEIYNTTHILKKNNKLCLYTYVYCFVSFIILGLVPDAGSVLALLTFIYGAGLLIYMVFNHDKYEFNSVCELFFQSCYVFVLFAHIILVRKLPFGEYLVWIIFITAWLSDTMAFFVGKYFGKNKLMPEISPKKTVEGAIGGLFGSFLFNLIFALICSAAFKLTVNYLAVICLSVVAGVLSQLGDLVASSIKREHNIKDYSNLLPGHGGVLDRFDSVLFVAPTVYYFVVIFTIFA